MKKKLILLCLAVLTVVSFSYRQKKKEITSLGIVSYTYRNSFKNGIANTLDTIQSLGIHNMEFSSLFGAKAIELRKMLDERNIKCTSFGVSYDDLVNQTDKVAQNAKALGAEYVRVASIPHNGPFTEMHVKKAVEDFNKAGKRLKEEYDLKFCYHNHGYEFQPYNNGTFFDYLVKNTDSAYVNFEMDVLWVFHPGEDPVELLNKYPGRFKLMHVKDLKKGVKGDYSGHTPVENDVALGTGQLDLPTIVSVAKATGVKYFYIEDESPNVKTQVPVSIKYLTTLLNKK